MNRARPMAARLIKPRVDYEPRSAHGRAVKNRFAMRTCVAYKLYFHSDNIKLLSLKQFKKKLKSSIIASY